MATKTSSRSRLYSTSVDYEKKLTTVMARFGVKSFDYNWDRKGNVYIEMLYNGHAYRFENSFEKAKDTGRKISYAQDLFAEIVLSLEGLVRATEKGIFTLDVLLSGVPSLPAASTLPGCVAALGLDHIPQSVDEVRAAYKEACKTAHPDVGGSEEAFVALKFAYDECAALVNGAARA